MPAPLCITIDFDFDGLGGVEFRAYVVDARERTLARGASLKNAATAIGNAVAELAKRTDLTDDDLAFAMGILTKMHRTVSGVHGGVS